MTIAELPDLHQRVVSVILPTHNSERFLDETLSAVLSQSHSALELLATDDGSADRTPELLEKWASRDTRVKVARHSTPLGPAHARNNSIERAQGRYLAFCDSDDVWATDKLAKQLAFMERIGSPFTFTATKVIDEVGQPTGRFVDLAAPDSVDYRDMLRKRAVLSCSTVVLDRSRFPSVRMPPLFRGQDYATWLAILRIHSCRASCLREPLTSYRITPGSVSRNKVKKAIGQWRIYRDVERLSLVESMVSFWFYGVRALLR